MKNLIYRIGFCSGLLLMGVLMSGCADVLSTCPPRDHIAPTVISTTPVNLTSDVPINRSIAATFSESMNPATIKTSTFTLFNGETTVDCLVSYSGITAILNPTGNLLTGTTYTATISASVADLAGNLLVTAKTWSFITGVAEDAAAPTVISTGPANLATDVPINGNISAIFNEAVDPSTINADTFTLKHGSTSIDCAVSYANKVATLNSNSDLSPNTTYEATISTGVEDLAGNTIAVAKTWTFTTGAVSVSGNVAVNLRTAGNFVILSKSGISTTGTSVITGDIGVSPIGYTAITGFGLIMDGSNTFSTSSLVTGEVFASNYTEPTPTYLTAAIGDMQTAYLDAAGRTLPTETEKGAGNIGGMTITPGLYKWSTGLLIDSDVTLTGGATDVWIFQIAGDLTMASGVNIHLAGGALAKNIFWQCFGAVALNTTAHLEGIVMSQTEITLAAGATVNGRLLSQTAVTLIAATVTQPAE